jgi:hypothetical protein
VRKIIFSLTALAALVLVETAQAYPVRLLAHNQRSGAGTGQPSVLRWDGCTDYAQYSNCINPASQMAARGMTASTALWDWNPTTGVLSMTGMFNSASSLSSQSMGPMVIGDKVTDLTIDTTTNTTSAATYNCIEGNFLSGVGANGCLNTNIGGDFVDSSSAAYNVGGNANCVVRTIGGDDTSTGNVRTLFSTAGGGGCDPGDGAFNLWEVVQDDTGAGGELIISNNTDLFAAGVNYLTFEREPATANADTGNGAPDIAFPVDILANDRFDPANVTVAITTPPNPVLGSVSVTGSPGPAAGITVTFTATSSASGTAFFEYTINDGQGVSAPARVDITILQIGANDVSGTTTRNKPVDVLLSYPGYTNVSISFAAPSAGGTVTLNGQSAHWVPDPGYAGAYPYTNTFDYTVTDNDGVLPPSTGEVSITVTNSSPVAGDTTVTLSTQGVAPDTASYPFDAATLAGNVMGDAPSTVTASNQTNGSTTISGTTVTFTLAAGFYSGTASFDYTISDGDPGDPEDATGTVTVNVPDVAPVVANATGSTASGTATTRTMAVTAGNGPLSAHSAPAVGTAVGGTCAVTAGAGTNSLTVQFTPNAGFSGSGSCQISVNDADGDTGTGTLTVSVAAAPATGGGGANLLPGGGGSLDAWALSLLASGLWLRRKRRAA